MWETIKNNPWKIFLGSTGTIIFTVVGFLFSDARYVHQSEYIKDKIAIEELQKQIEQLKVK